MTDDSRPSDGDRPIERRHLIDQSKLLNKRGKKLVAESRERIERREQRWEALPVGRVCVRCLEAQASGEFEDTDCA
jgi:hypothetical protein